MKKHDHAQVIARAIEAAPECENITDVARAIGVARSTLRDVMEGAGYDGYEDLVVKAVVESTDSIRLLREQTKYYQKQVRRLEGRLTGRQWLRDEVAGQMSVLKPVPVPRLDTKSKMKMSPQVGVLEFSDAHFGHFVPPGQLGVFGEYSTEVAEARTVHTFKMFAHLMRMRPFPVEEVVVYLLGDNVENCNMRPSQAKQVDSHVVQQTIQFSNVLAHCLQFLCGEFERVRVEAVPGNHGRTTRKAGDNLPDETFDHLAYYIASVALKDQPNFKMNIHQAWYFVDEIFSWKFLGLHGEDVLGWAGIPFYGIERAIKNYYMMLGKVSLENIRDLDPLTEMAVEQFLSMVLLPDYVCIGHFHTRMTWDVMGVEVLANGALSGVSLYSAKRLKRLSRPRQETFCVHPEHGVSERCPINLSRIK